MSLTSVKKQCGSSPTIFCLDFSMKTLCSQVVHWPSIFNTRVSCHLFIWKSANNTPLSKPLLALTLTRILDNSYAHCKYDSSHFHTTGVYRQFVNTYIDNQLFGSLKKSNTTIYIICSTYGKKR